MQERLLDCRGISCPMPIVEVTKTARTLAGGDRIVVLASDLAFPPDIEAWICKTGHKLESLETGDTIRAVIEIRADQPAP